MLVCVSYHATLSVRFKSHVKLYIPGIRFTKIIFLNNRIIEMKRTVVLLRIVVLRTRAQCGDSTNRRKYLKSTIDGRPINKFVVFFTKKLNMSNIFRQPIRGLFSRPDKLF